jgi:hypothetical protein
MTSPVMLGEILLKAVVGVFQDRYRQFEIHFPPPSSHSRFEHFGEPLEKCACGRDLRLRMDPENVAQLSTL